MLTLFTTPKPFVGHIGDIQTNAIRSWSALRPMIDIIVFGDEIGAAEIAHETGATHVPEVPRNRWGTPFVAGLFEAAANRSPHGYICYINADIILTDDFTRQAAAVARWRQEFLMVGRRTNLDVKGQLDVSRPNWANVVLDRARSAGRLDSSHAIDFFMFHKKCFSSMPQFAIGRFAWDNWLIYSAVSRGIPVVDVTKSVTVVHQNHDYSHMPSDKDKADLWNSEEATLNRELAGGPLHLMTLDDATFLSAGSGISRNYSWLRMRRLLARYIKKLAPGTVQSVRKLTATRT